MKKRLQFAIPKIIGVCLLSIFLLMSTVLLLAVPVFAQENGNSYSERPENYLRFCEDEEMIRVCTTFALSHIEGGGVGYNHGYTTGELLYFPLCGPMCLWPFIDFQVHYLNNDEYAANTGIGVRYVPCCSPCRIWGVNAFFDYRSSCDRALHFTQAGIGLEMLSCCWDIRLNFYYPIKRQYTIQHCDFRYPGGFFIIRDRYQSALRGFNLELGHYFFRTECFKLFAGIGPYYYGGDVCRKPYGFQARGYLEYIRNFRLQGFVSWDRVFGTRVQGEIAIYFPFGCCPERSSCQDILSQPLYRNDMIVLDEFCKWQFNF